MPDTLPAPAPPPPSHVPPGCRRALAPAERLIPFWVDDALRARIDAFFHARTDRMVWDRSALLAALADERREAQRAPAVPAYAQVASA